MSDCAPLLREGSRTQAIFGSPLTIRSFKRASHSPDGLTNPAAGQYPFLALEDSSNEELFSHRFCMTGNLTNRFAREQLEVEFSQLRGNASFGQLPCQR